MWMMRRCRRWRGRESWNENHAQAGEPVSAVTAVTEPLRLRPKCWILPQTILVKIGRNHEIQISDSTCGNVTQFGPRVLAGGRIRRQQGGRQNRRRYQRRGQRYSARHQEGSQEDGARNGQGGRQDRGHY